MIHRERAWAAVALLIPIAALFGPALVSDRSFAFRDVAHFYYPLFEWCTREWAAGRVPLWNPQENIGTPVLADASSSLFYPGKLIFVLPLDFSLNFKLYVVGHVLLAATGAYGLARAWQASRYAAALAALAFSCGGSVVFQYSNIVFLVGAAWLPYAALAADGLLRLREWRYALLLGACLAMMILGGDPQAAFHALLIFGMYWLAIGIRRTPEAHPVTLNQRFAQFLASGLCLGAAAACGFLLAAVQVLPSSEATRYSERASWNLPRNVYDAVRMSELGPPPNQSMNQALAAGLFRSPERGTHHELAYDFSIGPWRLAEYLWPNIGGRMFPTKRRWFSLIPGEGRTWTPTLYLGLLPLVLGLAALRLRVGTPRERWLSWLVILFTLGSFGWFGIGWLVREVYAAAGGDSNQLGIGQPVGGIYWLMVTFLPTYIYFRYPAKLLPLVALGISQLAAIGWDRAFAERKPRLAQALQLLGGLSAVAAFLVWCYGPAMFGQPRLVDRSQGPFDAQGAYRDLLGALVQTALVAAAGAWLFQQAWKQPGKRWQWERWALVLTAVELAIANYWLTPTAPTDLWRQPPAIARAVDPDQHPLPRVARGDLASWRPAAFARRASANRVAETTQWEHDTLFPKFHLASRVGLVESYGSIKLMDYETLWFIARQAGPVQPNRRRLPQPTALRLVGAEYLVLPETSSPTFAERIAGRNGGNGWPADAGLWRMKRTLPRAWIVHHVELLPSLPYPVRTFAVDQRTREVLFPGGQARDFRRTAVVESDDPPPALREGVDLDTPVQGGECSVTRYDAQHVVLKASLPAPGLVVLSDAWYPGWTAKVVSADGRATRAPILKTNRVMRGVWLPAGNHVVEFRYLPARFVIGGILSAASWLGLAAFGGALLIRRLRRRPPAAQIE